MAHSPVGGSGPPRREDIDESEHIKDVAFQSAAARTRFIAGASHDLRQPLQALLMFTDELQARPVDSETAEIAAKIGQAADALSDLLNDILDVTALDAGATVAKIAVVPLGSMLDRLDLQFGTLAAGHDIALRKIDTSLSVLSDAAHLQRILSIFLSNAVRYTKEGRILLGCKLRDGEVAITVWDTGIGIDPAAMPRIFDEFTRGKPARANSMKGSGLGLAIARRLAELLGHRIETWSEPGKGSCFRLIAKLAASPTKQKASPQNSVQRPATKSEPKQEAHRTILVIDDEAEVRAGLAGMLSRAGFSVLTAADTAEALSHAKQSAIDAVVSDYHLSEKETGTDAIDAIRRQCGDATLPAIIVSGNVAISEIEARGHPVLKKPVSATQLRQSVTDLLARRQKHTNS